MSGLFHYPKKVPLNLWREGNKVRNKESDGDLEKQTLSEVSNFGLEMLDDVKAV